MNSRSITSVLSLLFAVLIGVGLYLYGAVAVGAQEQVDDDQTARPAPAAPALGAAQLPASDVRWSVDAAASDEAMQIVSESTYAKGFLSAADWALQASTRSGSVVDVLVRSKDATDLALELPYLDLIEGPGRIGVAPERDANSCRPAQQSVSLDEVGRSVPVVQETRTYELEALSVNALIVRVDVATRCVLEITLAPVAPPGHPSESVLNTVEMKPIARVAETAIFETDDD